MSRKPKRKPCTECGEQPKRYGSTKWCDECWLRHQPMSVQQTAAATRLTQAPKPHRRTVPASEWPFRRRWCSGCQSFRSLRDVAPGATRCRPCNSAANHSGHISRTYGVTARQYADVAKVQGGRCAICRNRPVSKRLATDHDHRTGEFRGLLCSRCNHDLLGGAHESVRILQAAIDYLTAPPTSGKWIAPERGRDRDREAEEEAAPF